MIKNQLEVHISKRREEIKNHIVGLIFVSCGLLTFNVHAIDAKPRKAGGFDVSTSINGALGYGDNVFFGSSVEESSVYFQFSPLVKAINENSQRRITFEYEGDGLVFFDSSDDNLLSTTLSGEYLTKLTSNSELGFGVNYKDGSNIRGTDILEGTNGIVDGPTDYTSKGFNADYRLGSKKVGPSLELGYEFNDLEFDNFSEINLGRDHERNQIDARLGYQYSAATKFFMDLGFADFSYSDASVQFGSRLDSSEKKALVGINWKLSKLTSGEVSVGVTEKDFDNFGDSRSLTTWNAQIQWIPTARDTVIVEGYSRPQEQAGSGLFLEIEQALVTWEHSISSRWALSTSFKNTSVDFDSLARNDDINEIEAGIKYQSTRHAEWLLSIKHEDKKSNLNEFDFEANTIMLSFAFGL
jgi:hypothetical protein